MTTTRWHARISRAEGKYHRVELEGAPIDDAPIALVKEPQHAVAIAALPRVADALRESSALLKRCECMPHGVADDEAEAAIAQMEGRHAG